jgi:hypothetical protein
LPSSSEKSPFLIAAVGGHGEVGAEVDLLALDLDAEEEEGLVAVLVEVGARDQDRAAQVAAGVLELALRPLGARVAVRAVVRLEVVVADVVVEARRGTRSCRPW